jgi:pSer/pThr/pTyr-binding forkhead associated (FHA) protein
MTRPRNRFELSILTPEGETRRYPLPEGTHVVGRSAACEIYVPEASISRKHATIIVQGDIVQVEDLESMNGTHIGDRAVRKATRITPGEMVVFGELEATLCETGGNSALPERVWLEVVNTSLRGKLHEIISPRIVIGRSSGADFQLNHPTISRSHAVLSYSAADRAWVLEDRKSANGTFVDDVMISQAQLAGGEKLRVGDVELVLTKERPTGTGRRYGLLVALLLLLGASIGLLVADLLGLLVE